MPTYRRVWLCPLIEGCGYAHLLKGVAMPNYWLHNITLGTLFVLMVLDQPPLLKYHFTKCQSLKMKTIRMN